MRFIIQEYTPDMEAQWLIVKSALASVSHTWDFVCRRKENISLPSVSLAAACDEHIIGLITAEVEETPGSVCWNSDTRGANVHEFGVVPEHQAEGAGSALMDALARELRKQNIHRAEFWTKDHNAAAFYRHKGLREIFCQTHFRFVPDESKFPPDVTPLHAYGIHFNGKLPQKTKNNIPGFMETHPFEPHECIGFEWKWEEDSNDRKVMSDEGSN